MRFTRQQAIGRSLPEGIKIIEIFWNTNRQKPQKISVMIMTS